MRELLVARWEQTGQVPPEIEGHNLPALTGYLWWWWQEISAFRAAGMGVAGIPATEIESWARQSGRRLKPWEFRVITLIDRLFLEAHHKQHTADRQRAERHPT